MYFRCIYSTFKRRETAFTETWTFTHSQTGWWVFKFLVNTSTLSLWVIANSMQHSLKCSDFVRMTWSPCHTRIERWKWFIHHHFCNTMILETKPARITRLRAFEGVRGKWFFCFSKTLQTTSSPVRAQQLQKQVNWSLHTCPDISGITDSCTDITSFKNPLYLSPEESSHSLLRQNFMIFTVLSVQLDPSKHTLSNPAVSTSDNICNIYNCRASVYQQRENLWELVICPHQVLCALYLCLSAVWFVFIQDKSSLKKFVLKSGVK